MQPKLLIISLLLLLSASAFSQSALNPWSDIGQEAIVPNGDPLFRPLHHRNIRLDAEAARSFLWSAPHEKEVQAQKSQVILTLPLPDGTRQNFRIVAYDMMEPGLAARYPGIRTFYGVPTAKGYGKVYLDWTEFGLRASFYTPKGKVFIDPQYRGNQMDYFCYFKQDYPQPESPFLCGTEDATDKKFLSQLDDPEVKAGDCIFRSYRLAVATTGEFSNFFGVFDASGSATILSAVTTTMNRVNQVYEKDFTIRLVLIDNTDTLFYYNPATDPFTNNNPGAMTNQNQTNTDLVIGIPSYDIGHVFGTAGGGLASLRGPCNANKASAMTGISNPVGDGFAIDYVAHEMGHQFGAGHTQNNDCNRAAASAMEPGSGSTIMGYAGICPPNVQTSSDDYFHAVSIQQVAAFVTTETCNDTIVSLNTAPAVDAGLNHTIPRGTPFVLTAFGSDPDNDPLTYCWEQYNPEVGEVMPPANTNTQGPMFRTFPPTDSSKRYFPRLLDLVANVGPTWEVLPIVDRVMDFRVTVRDGDNNNTGCTEEDDMALTVDADAGPFQVVSPDSAEVWLEGQFHLVTWNVAGSDRGAVNCDSVDILLSYDGGLTYPVTLATRVLNNGIAYVEVPANVSTTARVMVRCSDNIFFDISNYNFEIDTGLVDFGLGASPVRLQTCIGALTDPEFVIHTSSFGGFTDLVTLAVTDFPVGVIPVLSSPVVSPGTSSLLTLAGAALLPGGTYTITITGTSLLPINTKSIELELIVLAGPTPPPLTFPADSAVDVSVQPIFFWDNTPLTNLYRIEISTDSTFSNNVFSDVAFSAQYQKIADLLADTVYYWRIRGSDDCTLGDWSARWSFRTAICNTYISTDVPDTLSGNGTPVVMSTLPINDIGFILDLNVVKLTGTHTWISDLTFTLKSPGATPVEAVLFDGICNNEDNFDFGADDQALSASPACPPTTAVNYRPEESLTTFINQEINGVWTLQVNDNFDNDGGILTGWGLRVCYSPNMILPVELLRFEAEPLKTAIRLTWATAEEVNNAGFELQRRSGEEPDFKPIGWVGSKGEKTTESYYIFEDTDVRPGVRYYYRLNQLDLDGRSTLSDIVSAEIQGKGRWKVFPNPVSGEYLNLQYEGALPDLPDSRIRIWNAQGILMGQYPVSGAAFRLGTGNLPTGLYIIELPGQKDPQIETIIKS